MMKLLLANLLLLLSLCVLSSPVRAQDTLVYCNHPERISGAGLLADASLVEGRTYAIFYHFRNAASAGDLVVSVKAGEPGPLGLTVRQGLADPLSDPPTAGRQAMVRFFKNTERHIVAERGVARFSYRLGRRQVASGVLYVNVEKSARFQIYFKDTRRVAPGMRTVLVEAPRQDVEIQLTNVGDRQSFRIGHAEEGADRSRDGSYGSLYAFRIAAPEGRRLRVWFSPRGGKGGVVGSLNGALIQTGIVPAARWQMVCETKVGPDGLQMLTSPFGGVFYPVELVFQLL